MDIDYCNDIEVLNDSSLFVAVDNGFKYSSDGGDSWILKNPGSNYYFIREVARNKLTNSIFISSYLDRKIFKSTDDGDNWTLSLNNSGWIYDFISKDGIMYAVNYNGTFYKSTNDGLKWDSNFVTNALSTIAVCKSGQIFIGTYGQKIFSSNDSGKSWKQINSEVIKDSVYSIAINNSDEIFAIDNNGIISSNDSGSSWQRISAPINLGAGSSLAFDQYNNIYAGENSIIKSTNNGTDWDDLGNGFPDVRRMSIYLNTIYIVTSNGIFKYDQTMQVYNDTNYFPLYIGNRWQFIYNSEGYGNIHKYFLRKNLIDKDTLINGEKYYRYKYYDYRYFDYSNNWIRYSNEDKKIYVCLDDTDKVFMDFGLAADSSFERFPLFNYYGNSIITVGKQNLFNIIINYKGYEIGEVGYGQYTESFGDNIGPTSSSYTRYNGPDEIDNSIIINALVYDSTNTSKYFSNHYKPEISIIPVGEIKTDTLKLNFSVNHKYSIFFDPNTPHEGINFIDSVYMLSFYSRGNVTINNDTLYAVNIPKTKNYNLLSTIDTSLLKNGFVLNYKIIAKDKNLIPEFSSSPDSGYYQCVWGNNTSVNNNGNQQLSFKLEQNYPNPFNPSTTINYEIPSSGLVTIKVYDVLGREIATLVNEEKSTGVYKVKFDGSDQASGLYFYRIVSGNYSETKKMLLMK